MATSQDTISVLYQIKDEMSAELKQINKGMKQFTDNAKKGDTATNKVASNFTKLAGSIASVAVAFKALDFGKKTIEAYKQQEVASARLESIAKNVTKATDEQVESLKRLADETQRYTSFGDEVIEAGQSQLLSFGVSTDSADKLTGSLADLMAANNGVTATQGDAIANANLFGKALSGQTGALSRVGILLDENEARLLKNGDETTRVNTLIQIMNKNYGGLAKTLAKTPSGEVRQLENAIGDLHEGIGENLVPAEIALLKTQKALIGALTDMSPIITGISKTIQFFAGGLETLADNKIATGVGVLTLAMYGLGTSLKSGAIDASLFSKALSANPIGVVTLAVLGLASAMDVYTKSVDENIDKQSEFRDADNKSIQTAIDNLNRINSIAQDGIRNSKAQKKEVKELTKQLEAQTGAQVKMNDATGDYELKVGGAFTSVKHLNNQMKANIINAEKKTEADKASAEAIAEASAKMEEQLALQKRQAEAEKAFVALKQEAGTLIKSIQLENFLEGKSQRDQEKLQAVKTANETREKLVSIYGEQSAEVLALQENTRNKIRTINEKYEAEEEALRVKNVELAVTASEEAKEKKDQDRAEQLEKEREFYSQVADFAMQGANNISAILTQVNKKRVDEINSVARKEIQAVKASSLSEEDKAKKIEQIQNKLADERFKLDTAEWRNNLIMSGVNTALAVTKTLASMPYPASIPFATAVGVSGGVQAGIIASNKPQKLAEGGVVSGGSTVTDSVLVSANPDEVMVSKQGVRNVSEFLNGNNGSLGSTTNVDVQMNINFTDIESATNEAITEVSNKFKNQVNKALEDLSEEGKLDSSRFSF